MKIIKVPKHLDLKGVVDWVNKRAKKADKLHIDKSGVYIVKK